MSNVLKAAALIGKISSPGDINPAFWEKEFSSIWENLSQSDRSSLLTTCNSIYPTF